MPRCRVRMVADHLEALRAALADRYVLERPLAEGGMGSVFLARDRKHRRAVAIKVLPPDVAGAIGHERFLQEIDTAAGLAHPHIVPVFDSGDAGGFLYYVMPFLTGESLRDRLAREGQLPLDDALRIARDVADALSYAHTHGVVHRDIKPANILLSGGHAVVTDFGIAQAISAARAAEVEEGRAPVPAREDRRTPVVGTPAYMSPEQCLGSARLDGRSDLYSLGCVLYEMLAGHPPFRGETAAELGAQHFADVPPPLAASGRAIPPEVEQVVAMALAKAPADRFQTALQLADALPVPTVLRPSGAVMVGSPPGGVPGIVDGAPRRRRSWPLLAAALAVLLAVLSFVVAGRYRAEASLDPSLYVLLPFGHRGGAAPELLSGDNCESLLYEGVSRWTDVHLVNLLRMHDAKARHGNGPVDFAGALDIARELGAGKMIWGEVWELRDTVHVHAAVYDVRRRGAVVREQTVKLPATGGDVGRAFNALADSLLVGGDRAPLAVAGARGTDLLAAWRAYADGHAALAAWDLAGAEAGFRRAVELDTGFPHAQLWLAQVLAWEDRPAAEWGAHATAALQASARLDPRNAAVARGLAAIAAGRYPQACEEFDALITHDTLDFQGWYGRGECLARDRVVVKDPRSPSGWRFRSSYHAAILAYRRALQIVPSVHVAFRGEAFERLSRMLFVDPNRVRLGYSVGPDSTRFAARQNLQADTLAFVPYPATSVFLVQDRASMASVASAMMRNRSLLAGIVEEWVRVFPRSADASEALGAAREWQGLLRSREPGETGALEAYRQALRLTTAPAQRLRLGVEATRVLVKLEAFDSARALADSLLASTDSLQPGAAPYLAGLAALTGRVHQTASLLRRVAPDFQAFGPDGAATPLPPMVAEGALRLVAYAALGAPEDSIRALGRRATHLVATGVEPARRAQVLFAAFERPISLAFPLLGQHPLYQPDAPSYLLRIQSAALAHDAARVRAALADLRHARDTRLPGEVAFDGLYQEVLLSLIVGDTALAVRELDAGLGALANANSGFLDPDPLAGPPQAAGLVRAMALRARLAALQGDSTGARRWAHRVLTLWSGADLPLHGLLGQMRVLDATPARRPS